MPARARRGFTFVELVIILMVLSIVAVVSYSSWVSYKGRSCARYAAEQFVQDLRFAREQALVRSTPVLVEFGRIPGYYIYAGPTIEPDGTIADNGTEIRRGALYERYGPPLSMTPENGMIAFDHRGTLNTVATTDTTVIFGTWPRVSRRITVLITGYSRIEKGGAPSGS